MSIIEMDCPVCLEQFKPPILMLNCGHNLCETCANLVMKKSDGQEWSCPICRKTQFKYQELPRNWLAEQSLDGGLSGQESLKMTKCSAHEKRITLCKWTF